MGLFNLFSKKTKMSSQDESDSIIEQKRVYEEEILVLQRQLKLQTLVEDYQRQLKEAKITEQQREEDIAKLTKQNQELVHHTQMQQLDLNRLIAANKALQALNQEAELASLRQENERLQTLNDNANDEIHTLWKRVKASGKEKEVLEHQFERKYESQLDEIWEKNRKLLFKIDELKEQLQQALGQQEEMAVTLAPDITPRRVERTDIDEDIVPKATREVAIEERNIVQEVLPVSSKEESPVHKEVIEQVPPQIEELDEELPEEVVTSFNNVLDSFYSEVELKQPKQSKQSKSRKRNFFDREDQFEHHYVDKTVREIKRMMPKDLPSRYRVADYFEAGWHKYTVEQIHREHERIAPLKEQANRPYFGRMDLYNDRGAGSKTYYVGIKSMGDHIISWKTEAASIYYEKDIGKEAHHPTLDKVKLDYLRQIDIDNCKIKRLHPPMEHENSTDHGLHHALASKRGQDMQIIVATIQKEQNELIRLPIQNPIIIQGSAGSGKSVIALHRLSYLLYKYKNLKENAVAIFGPNKLFLEHIRKVLPELGNYKIVQSTFKEYTIKQLNLKKNDFPRYSESDRTAVVRLKGSLAYKDYIEQYAKQVLNNVKPWIAPFTYTDGDAEIMIEAIDVALYYEGLTLPYNGRRNKLVNWLTQQVNNKMERLKEIEQQKNDFTQRYADTWLPQLHKLPNFAAVEGPEALQLGEDFVNQLKLLQAELRNLERLRKSGNIEDSDIKEIAENLEEGKKRIQEEMEQFVGWHMLRLSIAIDGLLTDQLLTELQPMLDEQWNDEVDQAKQQFIQSHLQAILNIEPMIIGSIKEELDTPTMLMEKERARLLFNEQSTQIRTTLEENYKLDMMDNIKALMLHQAEKAWHDEISNMLQRTMKLMFDFEENYDRPRAKRYHQTVHDIHNAIESFVNPRFNVSITDLLEHIVRDAFDLRKNGLSETVDVSLLQQAYVKTKTRGKLSWLRYEDLPALLHVDMLMKGQSYAPPLSYLILDEAQDYMPFEIFIMSRLTTNNGLMLIGDLGQNLNEASNVVDWKSFNDFLDEPFYYELQATYRSTAQIVKVSNQIIRTFSEGKYRLSEQTFRDGEDVEWLSTTKALLADRIQLLVKEIEKRAGNYESIAIITKTLEDAQKLERNLPIGLKAAIQTEQQQVKSKIIVTTPVDAKGLEFDCVIIADLSEYKATDYDRKLAYVATSRALHELYIFHTDSVEHLMH